MIKHVVNDNGGRDGGELHAGREWRNAAPASFAGAEAGTAVTLDAGSYNVTETGPSGTRRASRLTARARSRPVETKTCTVTNDDQPGT